MTDFSIINILAYQFRGDSNEIELGIGYAMIVGRYPRVLIVLGVSFKINELIWNGDVVLMKEPFQWPEKTNIDKIKIKEVVIQTVEPDYTK